MINKINDIIVFVIEREKIIIIIKTNGLFHLIAHVLGVNYL